MKAFVILAIVAALGILVVVLSERETAGGARTAAESCRNEAANLPGVLAAAVDQGVLPPESGGRRVEVNELAWADLSRNAKMTVALALYCRIADRDGRGRLELVGWRDGAPKASITDGEYSD